MIDYAKITVKAGDGGRGAGSFHHIKGKRLGKADGGDGARGGDVYLVATVDLNTLEPYRFVRDYRAKNGQNGYSKLRRGAVGDDLYLKVPVGTIIRINKLCNSDNQNFGDTKQSEYQNFQASDISENQFDLCENNQKVLVAKGGLGGRGNAHLRDQFRRRPKQGENGQTGEFRSIILELKLIADVGLIGFPNSGKSTLLAAITAAKPQIAPYPFTTLEPNLGVLNSSQFTVGGTQKDQKKISETVNGELKTVNKSAKLILADIPGLIEGASRGKGLGDLFLRHIERTGLLVHLIDISTNTNKWIDYQAVRKELKAYSKSLARKKEIILLAKIDLVTREGKNEILAYFKAKKKRVLAISSKTQEGLDQLIFLLRRLLDRRPRMS